jgi:hypothetical protein
LDRKSRFGIEASAIFFNFFGNTKDTKKDLAVVAGGRDEGHTVIRRSEAPK